MNNALKTALAIHELGYSPITICGPEPHTHYDNKSKQEEECPSLGKRPLTSRWQRYGQGISKTEVEYRFKYHQGNIGIAPGPRQIVLDIDPRSGGDDSFDLLMVEHGKPLDTPHVMTGGGGDHYYFSLPAGVNLPAGGSLVNLGFPGVEWKTLGGQVVAPPSIHASGNAYEWEIGQELGNVAVQEIPELFLAYIKDAISFTPNSTKTPLPSDPYTGGAKYSTQQVFELFNATYPEGMRRGSQGIPRLVGLLRRRGVCVDCAVRFLNWWQQDHFVPPLSDNEFASHVTSMYDRYGHPATECKHGDSHKFLSALTAHVDPAFAERKAAKKAKHQAKHDETHVEDFQKSTATLRAEKSEDDLKERVSNVIAGAYDAASRYTGENAKISGINAELYTNNTLSMKLGISGDLSPILMHDPEKTVSKSILEDFLFTLEGSESKKLARVRTCGWNVNWNCVTHGTQLTGKAACTAGFHAECPTQTSRTLRQVALPDLGDTGAYREIWLTRQLPIVGKNPEDNAPVFTTVLKQFQQAITQLSHRKAFKNKILYRAASFALGRPVTTMFMKFMVIEEEPGDADVAIEHVQRMTGGTLAVSRTYADADQALLQIYMNSFSSLASIQNKDDAYIFGSYILGIKGKKCFQGLGILYSAIQEVPESPEEKRVCAECGQALMKEIVPPPLDDPNGNTQPVPVTGAGPPIQQKLSV